jgi:hypothetical protein
MTMKFMLAAAAGAATAVLSAGVAHADPNTVGQTWADARAAIQNAGLQGQVSARVGDRLSEDQCIVTGQTKSAKPARGFGPGSSSVVLVALDCNGSVASATNPGYSAGSPQGRELIKARQTQEWLKTDDGQAWCKQRSQIHPDWAAVPGC